MIDLTRVKFIKRIYIQSSSADPAPPLGTVLGNIGADARIFCTQSNLRTSELPTYFSLKTTIYIYENKSMNFVIDLPSISYFLNLLRFDKIIKVRVLDRIHEKTVSCVTLYSILQLAKFKFPHKDLPVSFKIILGTVNSMNITISK